VSDTSGQKLYSVTDLQEVALFVTHEENPDFPVPHSDGSLRLESASQRIQKADFVLGSPGLEDWVTVPDFRQGRGTMLVRKSKISRPVPCAIYRKLYDLYKDTVQAVSLDLQKYLVAVEAGTLEDAPQITLESNIWIRFREGAFVVAECDRGTGYILDGARWRAERVCKDLNEKAELIQRWTALVNSPWRRKLSATSNSRMARAKTHIFPGSVYQAIKCLHISQGELEFEDKEYGFDATVGHARMVFRRVPEENAYAMESSGLTSYACKEIAFALASMLGREDARRIQWPALAEALALLDGQRRETSSFETRPTSWDQRTGWVPWSTPESASAHISRSVLPDSFRKELNEVRLIKHPHNRADLLLIFPGCQSDSHIISIERKAGEPHKAFAYLSAMDPVTGQNRDAHPRKAALETACRNINRSTRLIALLRDEGVLAPEPAEAPAEAPPAPAPIPLPPKMLSFPLSPDELVISPDGVVLKGKPGTNGASYKLPELLQGFSDGALKSIESLEVVRDQVRVIMRHSMGNESWQDIPRVRSSLLLGKNEQGALEVMWERDIEKTSYLIDDADQVVYNRNSGPEPWQAYIDKAVRPLISMGVPVPVSGKTECVPREGIGRLSSSKYYCTEEGLRNCPGWSRADIVPPGAYGNVSRTVLAEVRALLGDGGEFRVFAVSPNSTRYLLQEAANAGGPLLEVDRSPGQSAIRIFQGLPAKEYINWSSSLRGHQREHTPLPAEFDLLLRYSHVPLVVNAAKSRLLMADESYSYPVLTDDGFRVTAESETYTGKAEQGNPLIVLIAKRLKALGLDLPFLPRMADGGVTHVILNPYRNPFMVDIATFLNDPAETVKESIIEMSTKPVAVVDPAAPASFETRNPRMAAVIKQGTADMTDAGWRIGARQLTKLARDPLAAAIAGSGRDDMRVAISEALKTSQGTLILKALLAAMLSTASYAGKDRLQGVPKEALERLGQELRIETLAEGGDMLADILMEPLRQAMAQLVIPKVEEGDVDEAAPPALPEGIRSTSGLGSGVSSILEQAMQEESS
jgi:hypothetical protein